MLGLVGSGNETTSSVYMLYTWLGVWLLRVGFRSVVLFTVCS